MPRAVAASAEASSGLRIVKPVLPLVSGTLSHSKEKKKPPNGRNRLEELV